MPTLTSRLLTKKAANPVGAAVSGLGSRLAAIPAAVKPVAQGLGSQLAAGAKSLAASPTARVAGAGLGITGAALGANALLNKPEPSMLDKGVDAVKQFGTDVNDKVIQPGMQAAGDYFSSFKRPVGEWGAGQWAGVGGAGIGAAALLAHLLRKRRAAAE